MEQASSRGKIFYGWWIAAVSFIVLIFHAGAAFYAFARFMPTLIEELGASTAAVSGAISVYLLLLGGAVGAAVGPILMGVVYDASGSYTVGLLIFIVAYVVAVGALLLARVPRRVTWNAIA